MNWPSENSERADEIYAQAMKRHTELKQQLKLPSPNAPRRASNDSSDTFKLSKSGYNYDPRISNLSGFLSSVELSDMTTPHQCDESPNLQLRKDNPRIILKEICSNTNQYVPDHVNLIPTPDKPQLSERTNTQTGRDNTNQSIQNCPSLVAPSSRPSSFILQSLSLPARAYCSFCVTEVVTRVVVEMEPTSWLDKVRRWFDC